MRGWLVAPYLESLVGCTIIAIHKIYLEFSCTHTVTAFIACLLGDYVRQEKDGCETY